MQHTDCKMTSATDAELVDAVARGDRPGRLPDFEPLAIVDQTATLEGDVGAVLDSGLVPDGTVVAGLVYDLHSGRLSTVVAPRQR